MENQEHKPQLCINATSKNYLNEIQKWGRLISITGFIGIGLMVLFSIAAGLIFSKEFDSMNSQGVMMGGGAMMGGFYLIFAIIYFFPVYYLFKFSTSLKHAIHTDDNEVIIEAFKNLKSLFKFTGVLTLITLAIYAIGILFGIFAGAASLLS